MPAAAFCNSQSVHGGVRQLYLSYEPDYGHLPTTNGTRDDEHSEDLRHPPTSLHAPQIAHIDGPAVSTPLHTSGVDPDPSLLVVTNRTHPGSPDFPYQDLHTEGWLEAPSCFEQLGQVAHVVLEQRDPLFREVTFPEQPHIRLLYLHHFVVVRYF